MADVLLFHHAQGLTAGVRDFGGPFATTTATGPMPQLAAQHHFPVAARDAGRYIGLTVAG